MLLVQLLVGDKVRGREKSGEVCCRGIGSAGKEERENGLEGALGLWVIGLTKDKLYLNCSCVLCQVLINSTLLFILSKNMLPFS